MNAYLSHKCEHFVGGVQPRTRFIKLGSQFELLGKISNCNT